MIQQLRAWNARRKDQREASVVVTEIAKVVGEFPSVYAYLVADSTGVRFKEFSLRWVLGVRDRDQSFVELMDEVRTIAREECHKLAELLQ